MAGRGCSITVYVNPGNASLGTFATVFGERTAITQIEEHENGMVGWVLPLFVALHTPLEVLREQLEEQTGYSPDSQVLILCDLSDNDRNNDHVLDSQYDHCSLYDCNIREGSVLSLHPIGASVSISENEDEIATGATVSSSQQETHSISTPITAAQADHSYNGIIFDIESKGPFELEILSLSVGGMLGRVRIFCRDGSYEQGETESLSGRWWAHHSSISTDGWELVVDKVVKASWDTPSEIFFDQNVKLLPRHRKAFYVHSGLPDDLGIQYQSYQEEDIVAENEHMLLLPGLGHTGSEPFDEINGWYRAHRGLAGNVRYIARVKGWNIWEHSLFPRPLREAVRHMLLLNAQASNMVLEHRLNNLNPDRSRNNRPVVDVNSPSYYHFPTSDYMPEDAYDPLATAYVPPGVLLMSIPQFVLYYVMEFMHWDWFEELYTSSERGYGLMDYRDNDDECQDDDDDEYERFEARDYGSGRDRHRYDSSGSRSRAARLSRQNRGGRSQRSSAQAQQSVARLLTQMFFQQRDGQGGDEDDEEEEEEQTITIDSHTFHVMNQMFGGNLSHMLGGLGGEVDSSDNSEGNNEARFEDAEDEEEEEEETKEDVYLPVSNDYDDSGGSGNVMGSASSLHSHMQGSEDVEHASSSFVCDDDDDDGDDDDDEEYSRLSSRY